MERHDGYAAAFCPALHLFEQQMPRMVFTCDGDEEDDDDSDARLAVEAEDEAEEAQQVSEQVIAAKGRENVVSVSTAAARALVWLAFQPIPWRTYLLPLR